MLTPLFLPTAPMVPGVERSELPPLPGAAPADLSGDGPRLPALDFLGAEARRLGFEALYARMPSHGKA
ncbi:MAG: hypothetical protein H7X78_02275 [Methyloceanibacter sp.]|jgi:hypothetical protein|nr:hypothetical protein [Methyloceanibacter sp.]